MFIIRRDTLVQGQSIPRAKARRSARDSASNGSDEISRGRSRCPRSRVQNKMINKPRTRTWLTLRRSVRRRHVTFDVARLRSTGPRGLFFFSRNPPEESVIHQRVGGERRALASRTTATRILTRSRRVQALSLVHRDGSRAVASDDAQRGFVSPRSR